MISIITAIHNQLSMNRLYWESLKNYTYYPFELIIIDNASTDGSAEFFAAVGAKVIKNSKNYSYPHSQNQGLELAEYDNLVFMNNDVIMSPDWDKRILESMEFNQLEVASSCGIEQVENYMATKTLKRRWKKIKNLLRIFGNSQTPLKLMHRLMYPNWREFNAARSRNFLHAIKEGFVGNTVVIKRSAFPKIGIWDERLQQGDFDLYLRTKCRALEVGDIKPMHICLDVFVHHYIRLTEKAGYPRFADYDNLIKLEAKWSPEYTALLSRLNK